MTFPHRKQPVMLWVFVHLLQRPVLWLAADKLFLLPQRVSEPYGGTSFFTSTSCHEHSRWCALHCWLAVWKTETWGERTLHLIALMKPVCKCIAVKRFGKHHAHPQSIWFTYFTRVWNAHLETPDLMSTHRVQQKVSPVKYPSCWLMDCYWWVSSICMV